MSEVNANDLTEINNADDVFDLYLGTNNNCKAGIEVELSFFDPTQQDIPAMNLSQNKRLVKNINSKWLHNEPTSELLEIATIADTPENINNVLEDTNNKINILNEEAKKIGLKRSYFQELPEKTADDLLSRIVDVDRYKIMYDPYREDMKECVRYFAICKSNQVSISPKNSDHMLENVRRLYMLAPFLFLLSDNSTGFCEGKPFKNHIGMTLRHKGLLQGRGGIPPYVFTAKSGDEFIKCHINHVMNNPLFMYYDKHGKLIQVPSGNWEVTFNSLKNKGLNTSSNYYLAQSIMWPDVKIATLKDNEGNIISHRYEARMFGVGIHQHQSAFIITTALAFNNNFAAKVDDLLLKYGFSNYDYDIVKKSYHNAREHNAKFFDIQYGTGKMSNFAKEFADIIADINIEQEKLTPIIDICESGYTDGKVNRIVFKELDDVVNFQKNYDISIFNNLNTNARILFADKL